jgi:hypothetical protein
VFELDRFREVQAREFVSDLVQHEQVTGEPTTLLRQIVGPGSSQRRSLRRAVVRSSAWSGVRAQRGLFIGSASLWYLAADAATSRRARSAMEPGL